MAKNSVKILLAGDSFAAKWPNSDSGWPDLLSQSFDVTNIAQAGIGEYKILKQIKNSNLKQFDLVIVSHTSPYRIHTPNHPIKRSGLHENCDLIYLDLEANLDKKNESLMTAVNWFKYHYDEEYQCDTYDLIRKEINRIIDVPYLCLDHNPITSERSFEKYKIDFSLYWEENRGNVNHYSNQGNIYVSEIIKEKIKEII